MNCLTFKRIGFNMYSWLREKAANTSKQRRLSIMDNVTAILTPTSTKQIGTEVYYQTAVGAIKLVDVPANNGWMVKLVDSKDEAVLALGGIDVVSITAAQDLVWKLAHHYNYHFGQERLAKLKPEQLARFSAFLAQFE